MRWTSIFLSDRSSSIWRTSQLPRPLRCTWEHQRDQRDHVITGVTMLTQFVSVAEGASLNIMDWLVVSTPLKNISQLKWLFPIDGKIKHVPNHQPVEHHGTNLNGSQWWTFQQSHVTGCWRVHSKHLQPLHHSPSPPLISARLHELLAIPAKQTWSVGVKLFCKDMPPENTVRYVR